MAQFYRWRLMRMFASSIGVTFEDSQRGFMRPWPNLAGAVDAPITSQLHIMRHRRRATDQHRSRHPTTARRGRSALGRNDLGDRVAAGPIHDLLDGHKEPALHRFRAVFEASLG